MEFKRKFKFPAGCHLLKRDSNGQPCGLESIDGIEFELRVTSKGDSMEARRNAKQWNTDAGEEVTRLSFLSWRGQPVKQPFAEFVDLDTNASNFVELAWGVLNVGVGGLTEGMQKLAKDAGLDPLEDGTTKT